MRITCEQCGKSIYSESCKKYCDEKKRWEQFDKAQLEVKDHEISRG